MKGKMGNIFFYAVYILAGILLGMVDGGLSQHFGVFGAIIALLAFFYIGFFAAIIVHEAGHLVFGLLSGYGFSSFRFLNWMWKKEESGIVLKKFHLAGTAGQCIMTPPAYQDGKLPYLLYNLGGVLANAITGLLALGICLIVDNSLIRCFLQVFAIISFALGLTNGVPVKTDQVSNDGYNILEIAKSEEAKRAFWVQMKTNEALSKGQTLLDMDQSWFELSESADLNNAMIATQAVLAANYEFAKGDFEKAESLMRSLIQSDNGVLGLHKSLLNMDLATLVLLKGENPEEAERIMEAEKTMLQQMKDYPSVIRTQYLYDLIVLKDEAKAMQEMDHFEKVSLSYPYPRELEAERKLMQKIRDERKIKEEE